MDLADNGDIPVLTVCRRGKKVVSVIKNFQGDDAIRVYNILTGVEPSTEIIQGIPNSKIKLI